ncbi:MAG: serine/threonine protein kinase [Kiritimatiellae bacterium]|nr:serine/threonine protein kinase [Kiritimatiellia bacterium]MDW8458056.1 serine/threonine-protein kinase [Verrucomicrobiota bacterium]
MSKTFQPQGYQILEKIAEGGMSTVWKARQLSLDRLVAIKAMSPAYLPDADAWQRFKLEARAAARLSHPGIVQVFDAGESDGIPFIVMEFVEGHSLGEMIMRRGRLPEREALDIAEQAARALAYAWDKDCIIHCDIKPDNLMIAADGSVKVTDLGLARFIGLQRQKLDADKIVGTPNYTAPEQAQGVQDLDCRVDIYSLGATLYHMVTGRIPFEGSPGSSAMDRHVTDFLPDPVEIVADLQQPVAWLIEKMMVKDRAFRPAYWSVVLEDLTEVRQGRMPRDPLPEPGQSTVARSTKRVPSSRRDAVAAKTVPGVVRAVPKKKVVIKSDAAATSAGRLRVDRPTKSSSSRGILFETFALLVIGAMVYVFFFSGLPLRIRFRPLSEAISTAKPEPDAAAAAVGADKAAPEPARTAASETAPQIEAAPEPQPQAAEPELDEHGIWRDEVFRKGARAFNQALELYQNFQATRSDRSALSRAESLVREAVNAFESCKDRAPPAAKIEEHLQNAYRLLSDIRQSTLVDESPVPLADRVGKMSASGPAAQAAHPSEEAGGLRLSPTWNKVALGPSAIWEDLKVLLGPHGRPEVDTSPRPGLVLASQVTYLMPAEAAARALGAPLGVRRVLETPGYPWRSFNYYTLRGKFGDKFDQAYLVTDAANQVVALQLFTDVASPSEFQSREFSPKWRVYDLVLGQIVRWRELQVAHRVTSRDGVLIIQTELTDLEPMSRFAGRCEYRSALYLPQPVANLILARLEKAR